MSTLLSLIAPYDVQQKAAEWCRSTRKQKGYKSRKALHLATGIPEATIKHFEVTGEISFKRLLLIIATIGDLDQAIRLFENEPPAPKTIKEVLNS